MEIIIFRKQNPAIWFYFNIGTYEIHWKRCVLDFFIEIRGKVRGFTIGWEREL